MIDIPADPWRDMRNGFFPPAIAAVAAVVLMALVGSFF